MDKTINTEGYNPRRTFIFLGFCGKAGHYSLKDRNTGEIREGDYDNLEIKMAVPFEIKDNFTCSLGWDVFTFKIKKSNAASVFDVEEFEPLDYGDWLLHPVNVAFNRNGDLISVSL